MWVDTADLPTNAGHPFFERLNRVLEEAGFDAFVEELCAAFYAARMGRPSLRPGRYFRLLSLLRKAYSAEFLPEAAGRARVSGRDAAFAGWQ